jgi:hypothetical protein
MTRQVAKIITPSMAVVRRLNQSRYLGPANVLVLYRTGDPVGQELAQYYCSRRNVPAINCLAVTMSWTPASLAIQDADMLSVVQQIAQHIEANSLLIGAILTCHWWPYNVTPAPTPYADVSSMICHPHAYVGQTSATIPFTVFPYWNQYYSNGFPLEIKYREGYYSDDNNWDYKFHCDNFYAPTLGLAPLDKSSLPVMARTYVHCRLEVEPVSANDNRLGAGSTTELAYLKRIIDDSITAEAAKYPDLGTVVLQGSGSYNGYYDVSFPAWRELKGCLVNTLYHESLRNELPQVGRSVSYNSGTLLRGPLGNGYIYQVRKGPGVTAASAPTYPTVIGQSVVDGDLTLDCVDYVPTDTRPAGSNTLIRTRTGTFVPMSGVFFRSVGAAAYLGVNAEHDQAGDFVYRRGAIVGVGQSFSYVPQCFQGVDYDYYTPVIAVANSTNASVQTLVDAGSSVLYVATVNNPSTWISAIYVGAPAADNGTMQVIADDIVRFTRGVDHIDVNLSGKTLRQKVAAINSALSGWTNWNAGPGYSHSRCDHAIRNGAAVAIGSWKEPGVVGAYKSHQIILGLWNGLCLGEIMQHLFIDNASRTVVGDPLYRPFGHHL